MSNREVKYHNKGQSDGAQGKYDPPIGTLETLFGPIIGYDVEAQRSYDAGYQNGRDYPSSAGGSSGSGGSSGGGGSKSSK